MCIIIAKIGKFFDIWETLWYPLYPIPVSINEACLLLWFNECIIHFFQVPKPNGRYYSSFYLHDSSVITHLQSCGVQLGHNVISGKTQNYLSCLNKYQTCNDIYIHFNWMNQYLHHSKWKPQECSKYYPDILINQVSSKGHPRNKDKIVK